MEDAEMHSNKACGKLEMLALESVSNFKRIVTRYDWWQSQLMIWSW